MNEELCRMKPKFPLIFNSIQSPHFYLPLFKTIMMAVVSFLSYYFET